MRIVMSALILALAGCAAKVSSVPREPYQEVFIPTGDGMSYFNNDSRRLCYTFSVPGQWVAARQPGMLRTPDTTAIVGVALISERELPASTTEDLVTRAARDLTASYERDLGRPLTGVRIIPADEIRPGAKRWQPDDPVTKAGRLGMLPPAVLVPLRPGWVAQLTAVGTRDDEAMLRHLLASLQTSDARDCYWPTIRRLAPNFRP